ncbi:hypothetical protein C8A05DRAFT_39064 [Staphylotrichum tortipilum]|uniref:Uncharacterized protein n=1 Tax=Staphylotrichum tortipilum TaxID=2831512 RepID=A0AAN6MCD3_9PEZI|nr:hypothetical protein C8A05DRAFT_39064 [Staphylotrichum longicolle]
MEELSDSDNVAKALGHDYELFENHWRSSFHRQYTYARNIVLTAFDTSMKKAAMRMAEASDFLAAKDEHLASRFSADILIGQELHQKLWQDLARYAQNEFAVITTSPALESARPRQVETIIIDSDTDEPGSVVRNHATGGRAVATTCNAAQGELIHGDEPNVGVSRPRRTRRPHPNHLYDLSSPEPENTRNEAGVRTILAEKVKGKDFVFLCPTVGPGYFVIRCDTIKGKCHKAEYDVPNQDEGMVRRFGYNVVHGDGSHVESEWVERSNTTLANKVEREKGAKPTPPARKPPRKVAREKKAKSTSRARKPPRKSGAAPPPEYGAARRGVMPHAAAIHSDLTAATSEAVVAGPSHHGGAPVAEMGRVADLWAAQVAVDYPAASQTQQEEADDTFLVTNIGSDLLATPQF